MGLEMQIVQDKLEVIDKRDERSSFLLFIHGLKWTWNDPSFDLVVIHTLEDKRVKLDQKNGGYIEGYHTLEDFEHFIRINQSCKVNKQVK